MRGCILKKISVIFAVIIMFLLIPAVYVGAEESVDDQANQIDELLDSSSQGKLSENGLSVKNTDELFEISPSDIFSWIKKEAISKITEPFSLLVTLLSVTVLAAVSENMSAGSKTTSGKAGGIVCTLTAVSVLIRPISACFTETSLVLKDGSLFMLSFVPVMSGIMAVSGNVITAGSFNLILIAFCELAVKITSSVLMPILSLCFCVSIIDAINPDLSLHGLITAIKKIVSISLGLIMTLFTGLLALESIVGGASDSLAVKTGKYLVSNIVPVVGGAVSDACSAVYGSLGILKNGVGTVGIAFLVITVVPPIIKLYLFRLSIMVASAAADLLSVSKLKSLFRNLDMIFGTIISIVTVFLVMLVISTAIAMKMTTV